MNEVMAGTRGFEPRTASLGGWCHIQSRPRARGPPHAWPRYKGFRQDNTAEEYKLVGHGLEEPLTPLDRPPNLRVFDLWAPIGEK